MARILLADDSPHAQRMGERILAEEGYEVVSVTDGETALVRLEDVDPDVLLVDALLPQRSGFDLCRIIQSTPRHAHIQVVMSAGVLESVEEPAVLEAGAAALIRKPFEASALVALISPLAVRAREARALRRSAPENAAAPRDLERERVEAAVTLALERALPALVKELTDKVLIALGH
jgi:DNA-binding response OmpR family regulator